MEDKIEVNEYVRTDKENIGKIVEIRLGFNKDTQLYQDIYILDNGLWTVLDYIVKHNKQLMELIEVKDLVCFKNKLQNSLENEEMIIHIFDNDTLEEVKQAIEKGEIELLGILTKESYMANCYKVGGEDEERDKI